MIVHKDIDHMNKQNSTLLFFFIVHCIILHSADDGFYALTEITCFTTDSPLSTTDDQSIKDLALNKACSLHYDDYYQQRNDIGAALLYKADINSVHDVRLYKVPLYIALRHDDISLATMALEHGASIQPSQYCPAINYACSIPAAELLIKHNALQKIQPPAQSIGAGLMQVIMRFEYDPALILLYHQHNVSATQADRFNMTPLRALIDASSRYHKHIVRLEIKLHNLLSCFKKNELLEQTDPATKDIQFLALMTRTPLRKPTYSIPYTILSDTLAAYREKALIDQ